MEFTATARAASKASWLCWWLKLSDNAREKEAIIPVCPVKHVSESQYIAEQLANMITYLFRQDLVCFLTGVAARQGYDADTAGVGNALLVVVDGSGQ